MLKVKAEGLELRGVATKQSKNGNAYYLINCETEDGTAVQFYCPDYNSIQPGLHKGDMVNITCLVSSYKGNDKLNVTEVVKC